MKKFVKKISTFFFPLIWFFYYIRYQILGRDSDILRVIIYHDIHRTEFPFFEQQIIWLQKWWKIITPNDFHEMISGRKPIEGKNLLITFDDGFKSNYFIAKEILNPLGIKCMFFIVSDFAKISDEFESYQFSLNRMMYKEGHNYLGRSELNMNFDELTSLIADGHTIGAHTKTHANLAILNYDDLLIEIISSAECLEKKLNIEIKDFAYTFGNIKRFSSNAMQIASSRYEYVYSGLRGNNSVATNKRAIRRDAINASDSLWYVGIVLLGAYDLRYKKLLVLLDTWAAN